MAYYDKNAEKVCLKATEIARSTGGILGTEHFLVGIVLCTECKARALLIKCGFDYIKFEEKIKHLFNDVTEENVAISERAGLVLRRAEAEAVEYNNDVVTTEIILKCICRDSDSIASRLIQACNCNITMLMSELNKLYNKEVLKRDNVDNKQKNPFSNFGMHKEHDNKGNETKEKYKLPDELNGLGIDMSLKAECGELDPVIGRSDEVDRIIQILSRRTKNNPVLLGEAGVGKTAIIEGLAQAINDGNVPELLLDKRIFCLDITSMVAGTKYRGEYEERLKKAIDAIKAAGNIIVFIDEIHMIVSNGSTEGSNSDMANIIKPSLARGELTTIGATTPNEYRKYIEKDAALERRFQPIIVNPPSVEDTITILKGIRAKYEAHHNVTITDEAVIAAAELSDRYINDRNLPDKAIDLIDEACSRIKISAFITPPQMRLLDDKLKKLHADEGAAVNKKEFIKAQQIKDEIDKITEEHNEEKAKLAENRSKIAMSVGEQDIASILSSWTGISVSKISQTESEKLMGLESLLHKRVIGQDDAVRAVSRAVRRARAGLKDPKRPIGSFIFLGPTGVGKTELSKALAEAMFGDENLIIRIDMSEYMEKHDVSKMLGSAPGFVGYEDGGQLTEKVRRKPYSVVLFDEIEKAHPDVFNVLLQILEDGRVTDSQGRVVSFKNTIIIMTSNIGASEISTMSRLGFGSGGIKEDYEAMRDKQMEALKKAMRPEFINRIDEIIIFRRLESDDMLAISQMMLNQLSTRLAHGNIKLTYGDDVARYIADTHGDKEYGARPLRRAIQREIEDKLSEEIIEGRVASNDGVMVDIVDGKVNLSNVART